MEHQDTKEKQKNLLVYKKSKNLMGENVRILHLNLYRKYFDAIVDGTKTIEYRDKTDYWKKRIEGREYDIIKFRNGYAKDAPTMLAEYKGYKEVIRTGHGNGVEYELKLGKIIEVNYGK